MRFTFFVNRDVQDIQDQEPDLSSWLAEHERLSQAGICPAKNQFETIRLPARQEEAPTATLSYQVLAVWEGGLMGEGRGRKLAMLPLASWVR